MEAMEKERGATRIKMEEDIKRLEEFIKIFYKSFVPETIIYNPEIKAIESLIKGYRVLEKQNNHLIYESETIKEIEKDLTSTYISGVFDERDKWKNKIKEKIEGLDEKSKHYAISDLTEFIHKKEVLNELLEDK